MNKNQQQLRQSFDGNESFMSGFQIGQLRKYKRKTPPWVNRDSEIRKILLSAFPKLKTDPKQRTSAARWANVIHCYFRLSYTYVQTAEELNLKPKMVRNIVERVKRVAVGRRADNTKFKGGNRGRPRKHEAE
jgi:hypothetical protein